MKYDFDHWDKTEMTREEALAWFESEFEVTDGKRCSPTCPQCQAEEWAIKALKTMNDTISRQAAIEYYKRIIDATDTDGKYNLGFVNGLEFCINHLSTMPSAQPERKKGKWIKRGLSLYKCSECSRFSPVQENFCPSCGTEMEKADDFK